MNSRPGLRGLLLALIVCWPGRLAASPTCVFMDDFEDGDIVNPWGGIWEAHVLDGTSFLQTPVNVPGGADGSLRSLQIGYQGVGSGTYRLSGHLAPTGIVDLSGGFAGISFYVKTSVPTHSQGYLESALYDIDYSSGVYGYDFSTGTSWQQVTVPKSSFVLMSGTFIAGTFEEALAQSRWFNWDFKGTGPVFAWIDQVCLLTDTGSFPGLVPADGTVKASGGEVFIYPSPVTGPEAHVAYSMEESGSARIKVYNAAGRQVAEAEEAKGAGPQTMLLTFRDYAPGLYHFQVTRSYRSGRRTVSSLKKFVVQH